MPRPTPKKSHAHHVAHLPPCRELEELLVERVEHPERLKAIDKLIAKRFEQERALFVLDMSGFSRTVQRFGILHYLSMIQRMRRIVRPAIERNDGAVVKFEADNCFAVFMKPENAIAASLDIHHDLDVANIVTPDESDIAVSIGIGFGKVLLACDDMYGDELNLASKLGEDVAERGEILLTPNAKKKLKKSSRLAFKDIPLTVSGVNFTAAKLAKA